MFEKVKKMMNQIEGWVKKYPDVREDKKEEFYRFGLDFCSKTEQTSLKKFGTELITERYKYLKENEEDFRKMIQYLWKFMKEHINDHDFEKMNKAYLEIRRNDHREMFVMVGDRVYQDFFQLKEQRGNINLKELKYIMNSIEKWRLKHMSCTNTEQKDMLFQEELRKYERYSDTAMACFAVSVLDRYRTYFDNEQEWYQRTSQLFWGWMKDCMNHFENSDKSDNYSYVEEAVQYTMDSFGVFESARQEDIAMSTKLHDLILKSYVSFVDYTENSLSLG